MGYGIRLTGDMNAGPLLWGEDGEDKARISASKGLQEGIYGLPVNCWCEH